MNPKRTNKHRCDCPKQCFCSSSQDMEDNHVAGRKHVPWLWIPSCRPDHAQFHRNCEQAGVDFREQTNKLMGKIQAFKAQLVGMWMVVEVDGARDQSRTGEQKNGTNYTTFSVRAYVYHFPKNRHARKKRMESKNGNLEMIIAQSGLRVL